jgi:hypothetical protein
MDWNEVVLKLIVGVWLVALPILGVWKLLALLALLFHHLRWVS